MAEYIEREAAIAETRKPRLTDAELRRRLSFIPAADVVPVRHGRWTTSVLNGTPTAKFAIACSECRMISMVMSLYCPNCGARMDGTNE